MKLKELFTRALKKKIEAVATCPVTENGFVRIFANPAYLTGPGNFSEALAQLRRIRNLPEHRFLPDNVTIDSPVAFENFSMSDPKQITDLYLLAVRHKGHFVTLDDKILAKGGSASCMVIPRKPPLRLEIEI